MHIILRVRVQLKDLIKPNLYCMKIGKDWDEGMPLVLFAICETLQESLGFRPAMLVFGHTVRGLLKVLRWLRLILTQKEMI